MKSELVLEKFGKAFSLPAVLWDGDKIISKYNAQAFSHNPAYYLMESYLDSEYNVCFLCTPDYLFCGLIRIKGTSKYLILGPVSPYELTKRQAENMLKIMKQPLSMTEDVLCWFHHIPNIDIKNFRDTLDFLNYLLNKDSESEPIHVSYQIPHIDPAADTPELSFTNPLLYDAEQKMLAYIKHGRYKELEALYSSFPASELNLSNLGNTAIRSLKNSFIASAAIAARAAVNGGLSYNTALTLSDYYISKVERLTIYADIDQLLKTMLLDYTKRAAKIHIIKTDSAVVTSICRYIQNNLYMKLTSADVAKALGLTRTYISHHFKEKTKLNLSDYIQEQKIKEACYLLATTDLPLAALAEELGFSSQQYFQTVFKKYTHITPAEYRIAEASAYT